jgi:hypothetical protein
MKQSTVTVTSATTTLIGTAVKRRDSLVWKGTLGATGTFGGTAITWFWSTDGGTTKYPITSAPGTAVSTSAADSFNIELNSGSHNTDRVTIYATTTGGAGISLTIQLMDNN